MNVVLCAMAGQGSEAKRSEACKKPVREAKHLFGFNEQVSAPRRFIHRCQPPVGASAAEYLRIWYG
jgi:hypothetical protein